MDDRNAAAQMAQVPMRDPRPPKDPNTLLIVFLGRIRSATSTCSTAMDRVAMMNDRLGIRQHRPSAPDTVKQESCGVLSQFEDALSFLEHVAEQLEHEIRTLEVLA